MCSKVKLCILLAFLAVVSVDSVAGAKRSWWRTWSNIFKSKCEHKGKTYNKGDIFDESYDSTTNTCYYHKCGSKGKVYPLSEQNCKIITSHTPTPTTKKPGCEHNGKHYDPGTTIETDQIDRWCWVTICDQNGQLIQGDDFDCGPKITTTTPQTPPPTTSPPPRPGCMVNGKYYSPGETISSGQQENWCYGTICGENGKILAWDDFRCSTSTMTTTTSATTSAPTTFPGK